MFAQDDTIPALSPSCHRSLAYNTLSCHRSVTQSRVDPDFLGGLFADLYPLP
jgi:hypothetical protein